MTDKLEKLYPFKMSFEQFNIINNYANERDVGIPIILREFIDSLETDKERIKKRINYSKQITKLNEDKLTQIEEKEEKEEQEQQCKEFDKITEQEQEKFENKTQKTIQLIWKELVEKFTQDPDDIIFKAEDKIDIDKFIENKTKDLDGKSKEHIKKNLKKTIERYVIEEKRK